MTVKKEILVVALIISLISNGFIYLYLDKKRDVAEFGEKLEKFVADYCIATLQLERESK